MLPCGVWIVPARAHVPEHSESIVKEKDDVIIPNKKPTPEKG